MGCCIIVAGIIAQGILIWKRARANFWLNLAALSCASLSVGLLVWHWHHIKHIFLNPFSFTL